MTPTSKPYSTHIKPASVSGAEVIRFTRITEANKDRRIAIVGDSGHGKTYSLVAFLKMGLKVYLISSDIGGSGSRTIHEEFTDNPEVLEKNFFEIPITSYQEMNAWLDDPEANGGNLHTFNPDIIAWDGYCNFQKNDLMGYILKIPAESKKGVTTKVRQEGLKAEIGDWDCLGRGTTQITNDFLRLESPSGKPYHKVITMMLKDVEPKEGEVKPKAPGPDISGSAKKSVPGGFDWILLTVRDTNLRGEDTYSYRVLKQRGKRLGKVEEGDMGKLWEKLK